MPGYRDYEFDFVPPLVQGLVREFDAMDAASLSEDEVKLNVPDEAQGVYQLLREEKNKLCLVYVGKSDAEAGLLIRLVRHGKRIQHRPSLKGGVYFRALRVRVFASVDLETRLIEHYGKTPWNGSGFGSNDPGRNREETNKPIEGFDTLHPIDIDIPLSEIEERSYPLLELLVKLKDILPYCFRYQTAARHSQAYRMSPHPDILGKQIDLQRVTPTTRNILRCIVSVLPDWQATHFPGHVILYKESRIYTYGEVI